MSSIPLPRVLHQRKTSLELERENFEKSQGVSISKAINTSETPVKEKHVRSAILGTFHERCAETFWEVVTRLPLQDNRISAWKFCHVLHKVVREGHPQSIPDSYRHLTMLEDLGKLWGHLRDPYGKLIQIYSKLLIVKVSFHKRNPRIPGNLTLTDDQLTAIGENDVNNYFQLSVEMFDYMDEILNLESAIFGSLDLSRSNSMTSCGQCRLAPLIPLIQDSSLLYDICVKILFKLHASLPPDLLSGHRQRFLAQFRQLKTFYEAATVLQYFKNLIHIPSLPENPPNFLIQAELGSYVTPVVILPPEPPEREDTLSETSSTAELVDLTSAASSLTNGNHSPTDVIAERDNLIEHLQSELRRSRGEMARLIADHQAALGLLNERLHQMEADLSRKESQLEEERQAKAHLLQQAEYMARYQEAEGRAKAMEEKFQKLKEIYSKLREEHIQLLRQKAGVDKALKGSDKMTKFARSANNLILKIKADVDKQLSAVQSQLDSNEKAKLESLAEELASLQSAVDAANQQKMVLEEKLNTASAEREAAEAAAQEAQAEKEDLEVRLAISLKDCKEQQERAHSLFATILSKSEDIVRNAIHEVDNPAFSSTTCSIDYLTSLGEGLESSMSSLEHSVSAEGIVELAHRTATFVLLAKATSNTSPDIDLGDRMSNVCKKVGEECLVGFQSCGEAEARRDGTGVVELTGMRSSLGQLLEMAGQLRLMLRGVSSESIGEMVESELAAMDKAIEEAAKKIEDLLSNSRAADSGLKLEVNEKILDSCTGLMQAIRILVQKSRVLQAEIVAQGKGSASVKEFYKRNHQWTEGLISAAKAVGMGANYLLEAADEVVTSGGKIEKVIAAAQGISASTTHLVVASRVKANRDSPALCQLTDASKGVTAATAGALSAAAACSSLIDNAKDELDVSKLSLHNAKRLEMESQVKVLELENSLAKERLRLAALRRHHYSLAPETAPPL